MQYSLQGKIPLTSNNVACDSLQDQAAIGFDLLDSSVSGSTLEDLEVRCAVEYLTHWTDVSHAHTCKLRNPGTNCRAQHPACGDASLREQVYVVQLHAAARLDQLLAAVPSSGPVCSISAAGREWWKPGHQLDAILLSRCFRGEPPLVLNIPCPQVTPSNQARINSILWVLFSLSLLPHLCTASRRKQAQKPRRNIVEQPRLVSVIEV